MNKYEEMFGTPGAKLKDATDEKDKEMLEYVKKICLMLGDHDIEFILSTLVTSLSRILQCIDDLEFRQFVSKGVLKGVMEMVTHFAVRPVEGKDDKA